MQALPSVQQPCSNPDKSPERLGNASTQKYHYLQVFCNPQKAAEIGHAAFTRQRSLVRTQHRPPYKVLLCGEKRVPQTISADPRDLRAATRRIIVCERAGASIVQSAGKTM